MPPLGVGVHGEQLQGLMAAHSWLTAQQCDQQKKGLVCRSSMQQLEEGIDGGSSMRKHMCYMHDETLFPCIAFVAEVVM